MPHVREQQAGDVVDGDLVGNQLAARDVDQRRGLGDRDGAVELRVERDVVVEDLAGARRLAAVERRCRW